MKIEKAQAEIRRAYLRGGPGAIVSGFVWLAAGVTADVSGILLGFAVLFFGGMLIFPVSKLILHGLVRSQPVSRENPNGLTVIETIFPMISGLFAAWLLLPYRPGFVFPISALAVGAHYFGFRTAYGDWTNWFLGGAMCLVGIGAVIYGVPTTKMVPYVIAGVEISFGCWLTWTSVLKDRLNVTNRQDV